MCEYSLYRFLNNVYIYIYIYSVRDFSTMCDCMCNKFVIYVNVFVCKQYYHVQFNVLKYEII